jgi:putative transcriptional regulator
MHRVILLACVAAFLMLFDDIYLFITHADPHLKALLGAGLFLLVWLLLLWDDLVPSEPEHPAAATTDSRSIGIESGRTLESLLAAYAAGTLSEPFAVLVASHLQIKAESRAYALIREHVQQLQLIGAAADSAHRRWPRQPISEMDEIQASMPRALRHYVDRHLAGVLEWRRILPGLKQCRIARYVRGDASFLRCRPGKAIPAHTHKGLEAVLVLQGGFRDASGYYVRGDVAVADGTIDHRPVADRTTDCIIFIVREGPVKLTGPFGRLIQRIFGA